MKRKEPESTGKRRGRGRSAKPGARKRGRQADARDTARHGDSPDDSPPLGWPGGPEPDEWLEAFDDWDDERMASEWDADLEHFVPRVRRDDG
jgi:hypothetical protein